MRRAFPIGVLLVVSLAALAVGPPQRPRKLALREKTRFAAADVLIQRVQFSPDGSLVVSASGGGEAATWTLSGEPRGHFSGQRSPMFNAVFSPAQDTLATTGYDGTVWLWALAGGTSYRALNLHHAAVTDVAFCGSGDRLVTGSDEGIARLWDTRADPPKMLAEVRGAGTVRRVACTRAQALFVNTFDSGQLQVTTFAGKKIARFDTGQQRMNAIAISGDGKRLLTGSTDGTVKLWTASGHPLLTLRVLEKGWVNDARFSPDDRALVVASDDGHIRFYDISGTLLLDQVATSARVTTATFSPDNRLLAGATSTGEMFVYEVMHE